MILLVEAGVLKAIEEKAGELLPVEASNDIAARRTSTLLRAIFIVFNLLFKERVPHFYRVACGLLLLRVLHEPLTNCQVLLEVSSHVHVVEP